MPVSPRLRSSLRGPVAGHPCRLGVLAAPPKGNIKSGILDAALTSIIQHNSQIRNYEALEQFPGVREAAALPVRECQSEEIQ